MKLAVTVALLLLVGVACSGTSSNGGAGGTGPYGYSGYGYGGAAPGGSGVYPGGYAGYTPPAGGTTGYAGYAGSTVAGGAPVSGGGAPGSGGAGGEIIIMDGGTVDGGGGFGGTTGGTGGTTGGAGGTTGGAGGTTGGTGGTTAGTGGSSGNYSANPVVPPVTGDCPAFVSGTISYMGLGGIRMEAGAKAAGPTAPMLIYWHGTGSTAGEFSMLAAPVAQGVTSQGGVVVSFQGTSGGGGCTCSGTSIFCMSDMDIIDQFVACAVRDHNVDPRRIFTMGCSAGGLFSACLAANRSNYIAAAAPNSGGFPVIPQPFNTDYTPALMTVHGGPSDNVGISFADASRVADDAFKSRGGFVINCDHGGGHCGGGVVAAQVWEFFQAHPYGVNPYPWTGGLPASFPDYCIIY